MVFIGGVKYACERCIRGHRVTSCQHTDQPLVMIKPKGRPATQCDHCREARKKKMIHTRCNCGAKGANDHHSACSRAGEGDKCTCAKNKAKASKPVVLNLTSKGGMDTAYGGAVSKNLRSNPHTSRLSEQFPLAFADNALPNEQLYDVIGPDGQRTSYSSSSSSLSSASSATFNSDEASPASTSSQLDISLEAATSTFAPFSTSSGHPAVYSKQARLPNSTFTNIYGHTEIPAPIRGQEVYIPHSAPLSYSGSDSFYDQFSFPNPGTGYSEPTAPGGWSSSIVSSNNPRMNLNQPDFWTSSFYNSLEI